MALFPVHNYFVYNNQLLPVSQFIPSENEGGIYEVLRVVEGVPLFLEEHLVRFYHSAEIANKKIRFSPEQIHKFLINLIQKNRVFEGNILISCKINLKAFFVPHKYPTTKMFETGIKCGVLKAERENPNAKVFQTSVRERANKLIEEKGYYEVLLIDHFGRITEGSRSNIFFVKDDELITPPGNEVLLGITRGKTIILARELNIPFKEKDVYYDDLNQYHAAVITGTSPKILPVKKIENVKFDAADVIVRRLISAYNLLIQQYINKR
ncbi:MAG: aminotransferase class IV [Prolixibacteraceae bacterium]